jgi:Fe-S cluster biogenesis protein NfuA
MFIQTQNTPNPDVLKFLPGRSVAPGIEVHFHEREQARKSPLALSLFLIDGVDGVFLGADFIAVTKASKHDWDLLKPEVLTSIMEHFLSGKPTLELDNSIIEEETETDPVIRQIKALIETRIRPSVAQDGGDIVFHSFTNGVVKVQMRGACSGCPSSTATLKQGIENMLKHYVPEVESVESI